MSGISDRNPFVGPRSIQRGEPLYGRSREVDELFDRLQARRIVVLHSPSGAGKSSLIQAGLIPRLEQARFDVWVPIRVNLDPSAFAGLPEGFNRYVLSAQLSLESELPEARRRGPAELARVSLLEYLEQRPRRKSRANRPVVLLFDQFEEVLTIVANDVEAKRAFFAAVGEALNTGDYWALFSIRDDYMASLAPYRDRIPTGLANSFRLDLLGLDGAREVAVQAARAGGREFRGVDRLIRDLSTIKVQQPDGSFAAEQGLYVEPVQLQVVCRRLWEALPEDQLVIDEDDISRYANVSDSLAAYYAGAVDEAAQGDVAIERQIREWVGTKLIVGGIRSQVRQGARDSGGLANERIDALRSSYIVRAEHRAGANWFELSHDRLVEPVQRDNERWEQLHLHNLQIQARMWASAASRSRAMLLRDDALDDAIEWAAKNDALLTEIEREFLDLSKKARASARRMRLTVIAAVAVLLVGVLALGLLLRIAVEAKFEAVAAQLEAEEATEEALAARDLARDATRIAGVRELMSHGQGLPAPAALLLSTVDHPEHARDWTQLAIEIATKPMPAATFAHEGPVTRATWSPDGRQILTASIDGSAGIWRPHGPKPDVPALLSEHGGAVVQAAFSPEGAHILTVDQDDVARIWRGPDDADPIQIGFDVAIVRSAWSPDGSRIAVAGDDGRVHVFVADRSTQPTTLAGTGHAQAIHDLAWSPDGAWILTTSEDASARIWAASGDAAGPVVLAGHGGPVLHGAWSRDGAQLVTTSQDHSARAWPFADGQLGPPIVFDGHEGPVFDASFSPDGEHLATASRDSVVRVWRADGSNLDDPALLLGHRDAVDLVTWSPDGARLLSASRDETARVWIFDGSNHVGGLALAGHLGAVVDASFSPDGAQVVTASSDGTARVWMLELPRLAISPKLAGHTEPLTDVAWSPDGSRLVTTSFDDTARIWPTNREIERDLGVALVGHEDDVLQAAWSPDGSRLATASVDGTARIWRADGAGDPIVLRGHEDVVNQVVWSPDGRRIMTAANDGAARIWQADGSDPQPTVLRADTSPLRHAAWEPSGARIVTVSADGTTRLWDAAGSTTPVSYTGHEDVLNHVAWSPDGQLIATASSDDTARIWIAEGEDAGESRILEGHEAGVWRVAWSPDGQLLATASLDHTARIWRADGSDDGAPIVLDDHEGPVLDVDWSPDGSRLATSSRDGTARIWKADGSDLHRPLILGGHEGPVRHAAWSPDGQQIVTVTLGGNQLRYWRVDLDLLQRTLAEVTRDCLSPDQRQDYLDEPRADALTGFAICEANHDRRRFGGELSVNLMKVTASGSSEAALDRIRDDLRQRTILLRRCYRASLTLDSPQRSRLAVELVIDGSGAITAVEVDEHDTWQLEPAASACVVELLGRQRVDLPADEQGTRRELRVTYNLSWK